ncbi:MAG: GyrI-like domain-containing protein [Erysipelotrichales bacterium]|nr:GyrI-like domain-containing protein [Erysipelotrichales bacterium]
MRIVDSLNAVIEYIEEYLLEELTTSKLSEVAQCSEIELQKTFYALTNCTLLEYIRRRRLTLAAQELQTTHDSILQIALKYRYTSPDSFTRAFKTLHGITPSAVKKGEGTVKSYGKIQFILTIKGVNAMNYKMITKEEIRVLGIRKWFSTQNNQQLQEIPKMWDSLSEEWYKKIYALSCNGGTVGLCGDMYDGGFEYWIGCMSNKPCPNDLEEIIIPSATWAVFEVVGPLPQSLQEVTNRIYSEWLPNCGFQHANIPEIEYYTVGDSSALDYKSEVWIPIKK